MNGISVVSKPEAKERRTPSAASAANGFRWQPSINFVRALMVLGDALVIFAALCLGFWVRFYSGFIPLAAEVKLIPELVDYLNLLLMGTVFLLVTLSYLRLYSQRCFRRYRRTARVVVEGTAFWLFAYLAVSLILKFDPPISRAFMGCSFLCVLG